MWSNEREKPYNNQSSFKSQVVTTDNLGVGKEVLPEWQLIWSVLCVLQVVATILSEFHARYVSTFCICLHLLHKESCCRLMVKQELMKKGYLACIYCTLLTI